jgi:RHH-type proline utilization regulon transcriptional repressor/proline dehydrogenase/delta 1-pyrroline-5-carboxylate dehydrogenase
MESFLAEYGLSTDEGVALMCLAEAFLRVPDTPTLDALIRDKIGGADWSRHSGDTESLLVNASTWALMLTGRIYREGEAAEAHLVSTLRRMVRRIGEPVVRAAVTQAMRVMGQQFVLGRDIAEALERGGAMTARGYRHSFDMLGEAARTQADARRYFRAYSGAIAAISAHAGAAFVHDNPGISVKLSALHPRYETVQRERVLAELVPRLGALVEQARNGNIGFSVDAEEADRLGLSLEVIEAVLRNADLAGWDGFGIVVQAYSKQCLAVLRWARCLAEMLDRRLAVRLVKGAYWDMEIKHAQVQGLDGYPVFTRKASTDVSYLAGVRYLLDNADRLYPQFATHNAHTVAAVLHMAGDVDGFEFQRLHGMGEALHEWVRVHHAPRCRIYAPVGVHEDLLAYLVRRLLENGANSSFVHQLLDEDVPVARLVRDPLDSVEAADPVAHPRIALPPALYGAARRNACGWNINNPATAAHLDAALAPFRDTRWLAQPLVGGRVIAAPAAALLDPADRERSVGTVHAADARAADAALAMAERAFPAWRDRPLEARAAILERIADGYEEHAFELMALLTREAGKTRLDGVAEVREAVDFCRYYAAQARRTLCDGRRVGLGPFVCISPWNFPLAIFTGQIAAALVAGNTVVAKPAEQTPLIAARAVRIMLDAGVPEQVLALLPGDGARVGGALTGDARTAGVCFTGSTDTAIVIDRALAAANPRAPLIAETGGINAMIVDSTALPEAAVRDIVNSAFQSAGQRCSALRALFVQREVSTRLLEMLEGAAMELRVGDPWQAATDVGPAIDEQARRDIESHCEAFRACGRELFRHPMRDVAPRGHFVAPTAIRLERFAQIEREVFGPVLHVLEFEASHIDAVVDSINAAGFGLTFGLHTRLDDRAQAICQRIRAGNVYLNRNQIGAVVGVQPFGGEGLSGTGPKAGGPHYLARFTRALQPAGTHGARAAAPAASAIAPLTDPQLFADAFLRAREAWDAHGDRAAVLHAAARALPPALAEAAAHALQAAAPFFAAAAVLPGPTGESNHLSLHGRGIALCLGDGGDDAIPLAAQVFVALAAGNAVAVPAVPAGAAILEALRAGGIDRALAGMVQVGDPVTLAAHFPDLGVVAFDGAPALAAALRGALAARPGRRVLLLSQADDVTLFAAERVVSIDTTASGGNATLLTLSEV